MLSLKRRRLYFSVKRLNFNKKLYTNSVEGASKVSTSFNLNNETTQIPSRDVSLQRLKSTKEFDLLVIGGGATGSGAALDGALRGLNVACVEREDWGSGTSSRSTKLIWAGSRYLVQALVSLFHYDLRLLFRPKETISRFMEDFRMVLNCHRERTFLLKNQPHLTNWLPIAVPMDKWLIWPAPFNYPPAALGPLGLFPLFFKFYDFLGGFSSPPSHIMTKSRARRKFPMLSLDNLKYASVFYEGQHDDARTNLAIAQTAGREGAAMANYCNVESLIRENPNGKNNEEKGKVIGAIVRDEITGDTFQIKSKSVLFCGGPFTDDLRKMEDSSCKPAVDGASGIHIVLPSYYAPKGMGMVDMSTSDGRFLFFIPWEGHVVIGTTDHRADPSMRPIPAEAEIRWLLNEAAKYLDPELKVRRSDVLSAWSGIRPLAVDPNASSSAQASRDHVVSYNATTGAVFVSGGKWTTYREMAEDAIDKMIEVTPSLKEYVRFPCMTLNTNLVGKQGYSRNLDLKLIQEYGLAPSVAERLSRVYGGRAEEVCKIAREEMGHQHERGVRLIAGAPIIEAEVIFAARYDWAMHANDFIARRTRLAFIDKTAAVNAIDRVVELMANELKWDKNRCDAEKEHCYEYLQHFGGPEPLQEGIASIGSSNNHIKSTTESTYSGVKKDEIIMNDNHDNGISRGGLPRERYATYFELSQVFDSIDSSNKGSISQEDLMRVAMLLGTPLTKDQVKNCVEACDTDGDGRISKGEFIVWWNSTAMNPELREMTKRSMATGNIEGSGTVFG